MAKMAEKWGNSDKSLFSPLFGPFMDYSPFLYFSPRFNRAFSSKLPKRRKCDKSHFPHFCRFCLKRDQTTRDSKIRLGPGGAGGTPPALTWSQARQPAEGRLLDWDRHLVAVQESVIINYFTSARHFCKQKMTSALRAGRSRALPASRAS